MVGNLEAVKIKNQTIELFFTFDCIIEIPEGALPKDDLKNLIGERVGVINIDGHVYRIRKIYPSYKKKKKNKKRQKK